MVHHSLQNDRVPCSLVDVVLRFVSRGRYGDVGGPYGSCALRVAPVFKRFDGGVQPLSARQRHEALVQPVHDGGRDLPDDDADGRQADAEHLRDGAVLPRASVPPEGDGEAAAGLDGLPVVCPAPLDVGANQIHQVTERSPRDSELCLPLLFVEIRGRLPEVS